MNIQDRITLLKERHKELTHTIEVEYKHYEDDTIVEQHKKERLRLKDEIATLEQQL